MTVATDKAMQNAYKELSVASGEINHLSLEESILDQPQLFGHCGAWCAWAVAQRDELRRAAEVTDAHVELQIRDEFSKSGEKTTEGRITAMVKVSDESQAAHARYLKAKELAQKWDSVLESFKQRSYSLTQYVNWRSGDYIHEKIGSGVEVTSRAHNRRVRQ
jgi:hypothetical protein